MKRFSLLAALHGMGVLGIGLWWVSSRRHAHRTAQLLAYVCGCEVLWRMTDEDNHLPYMFGKYAVFALLALALYRQRKQVPTLLLLYLGLLLPASMLTIAHDGLSTGRQWLANDLSGPLAIAVCLAWFSQATLTRERVLAALLALLGPTAGVAFLCYSGTFGASEITFGMSSNEAASGGFGANQVSAALGFGIFCAFLAIVIGRVSLKMKLILAGLILWFAAQSALTYSRTGLYLAALSCLVASVPLLRSLRTGLVVVGLAIGLFVVGDYFILPALDRFTGGGLSERFRNTDSTRRGSLMRAELADWAAHPVFGVGVGQGRHKRKQYAGITHAHTEYTRMLAEHGMLGLAALVALMVFLAKSVIRARAPFEKGISYGMAAFGLLFMLPSATRLALPALALGLACARQVRSHVTLNRDQPGRLAGLCAVRKPLRPRPRGFIA